MKQRRISNSPLMDPSVCALVTLAPSEQDLTLPHTPHSADHQRAGAVVMQAAEIMHVPAFTLLRDANTQKRSATAGSPGMSFHREFVFGNACPWSQEGFVKALAAEDRSILILAGYWLEHQVLGTALHALTEGYDVYVLLDASPARRMEASQPARDRLSQAGATPVVTSQVIHEWAIEAQDESKRAALDALLSGLMDIQ